MKMRMTVLSILILSLAARAVGAEGPTWFEDFTKAQPVAKQSKKPMLLNFTGSDWCGWCKKMKKESLATKEFAEFAGSKLVLVEVDFPSAKRIPAGIQKTNEILKDKYQVRGFPTFVLIDENGKELGRIGGYVAGGPSSFISRITGFIGAAGEKK